MGSFSGASAQGHVGARSGNASRRSARSPTAASRRRARRGGAARDEPTIGTFLGGLPFARFGRGPKPLILFDGLGPDNRAPSGLALRSLAAAFASYAEEYTVHLVKRRPWLPLGCTTRDMARDYARALAAEFGRPVDVIGLSTGGEIAQHFAADHPELVRHLVLGSTACRLGDQGKALLRRWRALALQGDWRTLHASSAALYASPFTRLAVRPLLWLIGPWVAGAPSHPSDFVVTIDADLMHDAKGRLGAIRAPTLVIAGEEDVFYPIQVVGETAAGIPGARLEVLPETGHKLGLAAKRRFDETVLAFLADGAS